tara:strand:+ start:1735 stop:2625 length:891 start_codon:yes stop_codon:yes gene_type:complete
MEIAFFTEMGFTGKIPKTHENMRVEFAWMCALKADHYNVSSTPPQQYDLGIVIIPKKNPNFDINDLKKTCKKIAVMQEGPHWYFQDYSLDKQIWYYNTLIESDIIFAHNKSDKNYYEGLTGHKDVRVMRSLMIEDAIGELRKVERSGVIIGGNFVSWYGGFDSYIVAQEITDIVYAPSMGRKQPGEEELITHLPYMNWKQWIHKLNEFEIGIHLMRTHAAGTFALNCAYLGIPCIGYEGLDTQSLCHPDLTVKIGDLNEAKNLAKKLRNNKEFYVHCSQISKQKYKEHYIENNFEI